MLRALVAVAFLVLSGGLVVSAFVFDPETPLSSLWINLGTEIFGILITVAVVEWMFERRRLRERARELAWSVFHAVERAVWVWQGGPRPLRTEELLGIVEGIGMDDPVAPATGRLLVSLGARGRDLQVQQSGAVASTPGFEAALSDLATLNSFGDSASMVGVRVAAEILDSSATRLCRILDLPTERIPGGLIRFRDASVEAQEARFLDRLDGAYSSTRDPTATD